MVTNIWTYVNITVRELKREPDTKPFTSRESALSARGNEVVPRGTDLHIDVPHVARTVRISMEQDVVIFAFYNLC